MLLRRLLPSLLVLACALGVAPAHAADQVVGTGSAASCTEATFDAALNAAQTSGGGVITFSCGPAPHSILLSGVKSVSASVELRGGDLITLSGGNQTSLLQVFVAGNLTLRNITISRGFGPYGAIENFGQLTVVDSQLSGNAATDAGGAIRNAGTLTLTNVRISDNTAATYGGGVLVESGTATITGSTFTTNTAVDGGGAVAVNTGASATIDGGTFVSNRVTGTLAEGGAVRSGGTLTITGASFTLNSGSRGGAITVADGTTTVAESTLSRNWAAYGGAIRQDGGLLTITETTLSGNGFSSNGIRTTTGGGAISWQAGTANLVDVTIAGNWASYGGGFDHTSGTTSLTNVTITGNRAVGAGGFDQGGGSITLTNVTVADNAAPFFGGGIGNRLGTLTVRNTLVANNYTTEPSARADCYKAVASSSFSMSTDSTCAFGAGFSPVAVALAPLGDNGGSTHTQLPLRGSPVLDRGSGAFCPPADQRAVARPQGQACDIGAVEVRAQDLLPTVYLTLARR